MTQEATAFEREYYEGEKGLKVRVILKPKRNRLISHPDDYILSHGGGKGHNIRKSPSSRIPGGVTYTKMTPKMAAKHEAREAWKAERTWVVGQGWTLLEDDSEDDLPSSPFRDFCDDAATVFRQGEEE